MFLSIVLCYNQCSDEATSDWESVGVVASNHIVDWSSGLFT